MRTLLIAAVVLCVSGAAFAKDIKATVMTDSEMDKVTAAGTPTTTGEGVITAGLAGGNLGQSSTALSAASTNAGFTVGQGTLTAGAH
jgi:hypothetical protein